MFFDRSFLAPLAIGQRANVMVCCPSCVRASGHPSMWPSVRPCVRLSVRALTFSLNIFFSENYLSDFDEILQKCSCHGPLQNLLKKFDSVKNSGCHRNKTEKNFENFENFLVRNHRVRATKFGM